MIWVYSLPILDTEALAALAADRSPCGLDDQVLMSSWSLAFWETALPRYDTLSMENLPKGHSWHTKCEGSEGMSCRECTIGWVLVPGASKDSSLGVLYMQQALPWPVKCLWTVWYLSMERVSNHPQV